MLSVRPHRRWRTPLLLATFFGTVLAASPSELPLGDWKLQVEWPSGRADVVLTVTEKDGVLAATWTEPQGLLTAVDVTFSDAVRCLLRKGL